MTKATSTKTQTYSSPTVAIIGGGIAGATAAISLASHQLNTVLIEAGESLVNGPPICHLHAGGNLYREIDTAQCLTLLRQSIDTLKLYPQCADYRPTLIAIPKRDSGTFDELLPRLEKIKAQYAELVAQDASNNVLGDPAQYFQIFDRETVQQLAKKTTPKTATSLADWLIPVVKELDLSKIKFPLIMVQEYGLNVFRLAASAEAITEQSPHCHVMTKAKVTDVKRDKEHWQLMIEQNNKIHHIHADYLINACGYQSGKLDDLINHQTQRMVEFKAAYVTHWPDATGQWPEVIFYGERGTPHGMAQLTPYPDGYFQIHGMTKEITLFEDGLVSNSNQSSQPQLPTPLETKITHQWPLDIANARTQKSIDFMSYFIPSFSRATVGGKPLFGAQQIPGTDPELRAADVDISQPYYARSEIVKASSAIDAAAFIHSDINQLFGLNLPAFSLNNAMTSLNESNITQNAIKLTQARGYPSKLAQRVITR